MFKKKFVVQVHSSGPGLGLNSANIGGLWQRGGEDSFANACSHSHSCFDSDGHTCLYSHTYSLSRSSRNFGGHFYGNGDKTENNNLH